jgi:hypothetical protein
VYGDGAIAFFKIDEIAPGPAVFGLLGDGNIYPGMYLYSERIPCSTLPEAPTAGSALQPTIAGDRCIAQAAASEQARHQLRPQLRFKQ